MRKRDYFTPTTMKQRANEFLMDIQGFETKQKSEFSPEDASLLVLDMQKYFLDRYSHAFIPSAPAIVHGIEELIKEFQKNGRPVVFTRHINTEGNAKCMKTWWKELIEEKDETSTIVDELLDLDTNSQIEIIIKNQYDAFHSTRLQELLQEHGTKQVVITGVMTHLCCETTARSAFMRGYEVFFTVDGTATYNEDFHKATLLNLSHGFAIPVLVQELLDIMNRFDVS